MPIRILYMEDDEGLARLFRKRLTREGFDVELAPDGVAGMDMCAERDYDVIAVDHTMPRRDGLEVIRLLAEHEDSPPVIMITGTGNERIAVQAVQLGARDYIVKDGALGYLELVPSVIHKVLRQTRLEQERREAIEEQARLRRRILEVEKLESLRAMAQGVAHDFNNLLQGILGYAALASERLEEDSPVQRLLGEIVQARERAAELNQKMVAYTGQGDANLRRGDLSRTVATLVEAWAASLPDNVVSVLEPSCDIAAAAFDEAQMREIITTLLVNAFEALDNGSGTIRIRVWSEELTTEFLNALYSQGPLKPGPYVLVQVSDTGCGIKEKDIGRVFEPFYTTKFTGRGLGLASALGILRTHGGGIGVESVAVNSAGAESGTEFTVVLPAAS